MSAFCAAVGDVVPVAIKIAKSDGSSPALPPAAATPLAAAPPPPEPPISGEAH